MRVYLFLPAGRCVGPDRVWLPQGRSTGIEGSAAMPQDIPTAPEGQSRPAATEPVNYRNNDLGAMALPSAQRLPRRPQKSSFLLAETILSDIIGERLVPGDPLPPEREMVEKYGMGRTTVREALRLLEYQGAIQIRQGLNGGPYVQAPDSGHFAKTISFMMRMERTPFEAIVEVRSAIEPMICQLAAERINSEALQELERTIIEMRRIVDDREQVNAFNDLNTRFHSVIAWSSGNPLFHHLADSLHGIMDGAVVGVSYSARRYMGVIADHQLIYDALSERDPQAAYEKMALHLAEWEEYSRRNFADALKLPIP
ncbi:FadR/GntR family transcriptional regulator [Rhodococcus sp. ACPA1]|uniref:FadR/GntR family transcriptional regulator n=2 Tax=Rhodococcus TaxID=1827 RepID=UPI00117A9DA3|nr:FadR/GntR family transcriptional regulator [Rhodococcus sp. ACPA1]